MMPEPTSQHRWLLQLVGNWTFEGDADIAPGEPPFHSTGTQTVRALGDLWILAEGESEMPGGGLGRTIITLGYDSAQGRYLGTFVGSMMTHLWIYDGAFDDASQTLTLTAEGPAMDDSGGTATYQDIIELKSPDHYIFRARIRDAEGNWTQFMTAHYRRRK